MPAQGFHSVLYFHMENKLPLSKEKAGLNKKLITWK